jgi:GDP-4-dehydro-6-deoxy-D-mannose reductase
VRVLVTGAGGFVGGHLCHLLARQPGWSITAVGRRLDPLTVGPVHYRGLDLLDAAATADLLVITRPDVIIHLAALSSVSASFRDPGPTLTTNVQTQLHLLEGCRAAGLDPLILVAGSGEEYGESARVHAPLTEEHSPRPVSRHPQLRPPDRPC